MDDPGNPTDDSPTAAADEIENGGGHGQFRAVADARIQCLTCRAIFDADSVSAEVLERLEGPTDPADEMLVVPLACPNCGTAGSLGLSYGPQASIEESDVLRALRRHER